MNPLTRAAAPLAVTSPPPPDRRLIDLAVATWIEAAGGRSGSDRTRRAYTDGMATFRGALARAGQDLDGPAELIALAAAGHAGAGSPSPATFNQRLAILSSFYKFARKRGLITGENPIDRVDRRPVQRYAGSRALDLEAVRRGLEAIDRSTAEGGRDYCLIAVALQTGRRLAELAGLRWRDLEIAGGAITLTWRRTKGGKTARDTLPGALSKNLATYLAAVYGERLRQLEAEAPIWPSFSTANRGQPITTQTIRGIVEKHLGTTKVHSLRHTFAKTMERTGAKLSEIQQRLGHANAATTGIYLSALAADENAHADDLARLLGLD